jgi:hypothetical protein
MAIFNCETIKQTPFFGANLHQNNVQLLLEKTDYGFLILCLNRPKELPR